MEVAVAEEKKKIFRARKTMKVSDRQQLETLHNTLSPSGQPSSNSSSPLGPLLNGTHKEDGRKGSPDKELNDTDSKSPRATTPVSPSSRGSRSSPAPLLTLKLSPSPPPNQSPKYNNTDAAAAAAAPSSPASPFHSLNFELKKMEEEGKKVCSPPPSNGCPASPLKEAKECRDEPTEATDQKKKDEDTMEIQKEETKTKKEDLASDSSNDSKLSPPASPATSDRKSDKDQKSNQEDTVAMETDNENSKPKTSDASSVQEDETSSLKPTSSSSPPSASQSASSPVPEKDQEIKEVEKDTKRDENEKKDVKDVKLKSSKEEKMEVDDKVKSELKKEEVGGVDSKSSRPSSTPPSGIVKEEKRNPTGLKRTLSEGDEKDGIKVERDGKRPKVQGVELEAQLELKITAKPGSRLKLEKVVQQMVEERLKELQLTVFDQSFQELKDRVEKIDCANRHQSTILTLQAKVARLAKKFGEANQASENKKKQQVPNVTTPVAKTTATVTTAPPLRLVRTSTELKQIPATPVSTNQTAMLSSQAQPKHTLSSTTTSSAAMVTQSNILQLISTSAANASTLGTITSQSPAGTLLLKTTPGGAMMNQGQPLLIQLPLSMTNGQPGTLVNIPVSSFAAPGNNNNPLNKGKANAPATTTATFIIKASPSSTLTNTTASATSSSVPMLQASTVQISPSQMSVPRTIYQGGAGGISTPNAGVVSVTSARTPVHTVSVAGAMSSSSSPAASGPAATGSAAPGPPKGTALTSKTDNQATGSTPTKTAVPGSRPKGSVIDLTEDDDDVQVTGVTKKVTLATTTPSAAQRNSLQITIPTGTAARSSPQSLQSSASNPNLTVHHRPQLDSPLKARSANTGTPTSRTATSSSMALPPLPSAPPLATRLPPEAQQTSPPQQPQLKLVQGQNGIVLSWCVSETDRNCAAVESYHLYAYHNDNSSSGGSASAPQQQQQQQHWKKIGEVKALPLPMACTLTQFQSGSTYHFAVRARDVYGRFGSFCEPQCTNVINSS